MGLNNFAVALALGALGQESRRWRIATVTFLFEFTIPLVGLVLGAAASGLLAEAGRWVGAGLLILLGMLALRPSQEGGAARERLAARVTTWKGLIGLSAGLTLDNLVVGFALGIDGAEPLVVAAVIAIAATTFALVGLRLGRFASEVSERRAREFSGIILIGLGIAVAAGVLG